jgi:hypothetical protein
MLPLDIPIELCERALDHTDSIKLLEQIFLLS